MTRYTSVPDVFVQIEPRNGKVTWEKYHTVLEIDPDHSVRYYRETLETSPGLFVPEPTILQGRVTHFQPGHQIAVKVRREDSEKAITIDAVAGSGELLGELFSPFTNSHRGIILTPDDPGALFPPPRPREGAPPADAPPATPTTPTPSSVTPAPSRRAPMMTLKPGASPSEAEFKRGWERLNRHLRRHQGRGASLKLADLSADQRAFLSALFSGPLDVLEHHALEDLQDFYAAEPSRRVRINVTSITLPEEPGGSWEIVLGESSWGGVVIVYTVEGWTVRDATLVG